MFHTIPNPISKGAFAFILLTPLVFPGFFPFDVNLVLAVSAALLFISITSFELRSLYIPKAFSLAIVTVLVLQLTLSINGNVLAPEIWRLQTLGYLAAAGLFFAGTSTPASSLRSWMHLYIAVAVLWSIIGLFIWLGGTGGSPLEIGPITMALAPALKLAGPFNQGNIFATAIGFAWLFSHWLFIRSRKPIYVLMAVFFTAMLFDSLSKGGWAAFTLAIILLLFAMKPKSSLVAKKLIPMWLSGFALGLIFLEFSQPRIESDAFLSVVHAGASLDARLLIWASAFAEFLSSPWTGIGWGQFPAEFWGANADAQLWLEENMGVKNSLYSNAMSAHNMIFHTLAEAGVIAGLLLIWGIWRLLRITITLLVNGNSQRLPFALAATAFVIQSQFNISFTQPVPLLMAAFFTGIAFAPWLRRKSWVLKTEAPIRYLVLIIALTGLIWAAQLSYQWFATEQVIRDFDIQNEESIRNLADVATIPRIGSIPLIWLGYNIATTQQHAALLTWMLPYLERSRHEVPFVDSYQVLFYALSYSQRFEEACQLGQLISQRKLPKEKNVVAYKQVCANKPPSQYIFGH